MNLFNTLEYEYKYTDILQLDGAFSASHMNYEQKKLVIDDMCVKTVKYKEREELSEIEKINAIKTWKHSINGTEQNIKKDERILLWKCYWIEYIRAFEVMVRDLPNSIVTAYVGRQAIELGFKYLLLLKSDKVIKSHNLEKLSKEFYKTYNVTEDYMEYVDTFCEKFCTYIEGENPEYFRFPEYKSSTFFAGSHLDITWITYNFRLIILKLIHFANLDDEFKIS